jgi:hypothetical protein
VRVVRVFLLISKQRKYKKRAEYNRAKGSLYRLKPSPPHNISHNYGNYAILDLVQPSPTTRTGRLFGARLKGFSWILWVSHFGTHEGGTDESMSLFHLPSYYHENYRSD